MRKAQLLFVCLMLAYVNAASAATKLGVITNGGSVSFVVDNHWPVISMQTKPPISVAVFQIPNAADEGTPHSTNLVLSLYDTSQTARESYERVPTTYGPEPAAEIWEGWTVYRQEADQDGVVYTLLDAKRLDVGADVAVSVRLAWPHLSGNSPRYDKEMEAQFQAFLQSVVGKQGPYQSEDGEVIRRPVQ